MHYSDGRYSKELARVILFILLEYYTIAEIPIVKFTDDEMSELSGQFELSYGYVESVNKILRKEGYILLNIGGDWFTTFDFTKYAVSLPEELLENFVVDSADRHLQAMFPGHMTWSYKRHIDEYFGVEDDAEDESEDEDVAEAA